MPSTAYSAELEPDLRLRRLVLASGLVLAALGLLLLLTMNLPAWLRVAASVSWALIFLRESLHLGHNYSRFDRVRFDASGRHLVMIGDAGLQVVDTTPLLASRSAAALRR